MIIDQVSMGLISIFGLILNNKIKIQKLKIAPP